MIKETNISNLKKKVLRILALAIDDIECYYPTHREEITEACLEICEERNLFISCGSDCLEVVGREIEIKEIEVRSFFLFRDLTYLFAIEGLIEDGLYTPEINLKEGLAKAYKYYCQEDSKLSDPKMNQIEFVINN